MAYFKIYICPSKCKQSRIIKFNIVKKILLYGNQTFKFIFHLILLKHSFNLLIVT